MKAVINQFTDYLRRALTQDLDLLSDKMTISNVIVDEINHILTITTQEEHKLVAKQYVYLENIYYKQDINFIKNDIYNFNKVILINVDYDVSFNKGQFIKINGFTDSDLNKEFFIDSMRVEENGTLTLIGFFINQFVPVVDIQNEGFLVYKFVDDVVVDSSGLDVKNNYLTNNGSNIAGAYNGLKFVKEVVDVNTFKVDLIKNSLSIQPNYKEVYLENATLKKNMQIYTINEINDDLVNDAISSMQENKVNGCLFISKNSSDVSQNLVNINSSYNTMGVGLSNFSAQTTNYFDVNLVFRVKREALDDINGNKRSHYVLGYEANEVIENFENIFSKHINSVFFDYSIKEDLINIFMQSIFQGITNIQSINDVNNSVFLMTTAKFKVSRYITSYGEFINNKVGIPIKKVEIKKVNSKDDIEESIIYGE